MTDHKIKTGAIVLAAGQGKRMNSQVQKQYMMLGDRPLIAYALEAFEKSVIDQVVLVTGKGEEEYCRKEIVEKYGFQKVCAIVSGGKERYHSVYEGIKQADQWDYILIHDGARPLITPEIIERAVKGALEYEACVIGMPVKDTIKIADEEKFAAETPDRSLMWQIQTPQAFSGKLIRQAYDLLFENEENQKGITDDAMVVELFTKKKVKLILGDYTNIKVTTPEDIAVAQALLSWRQK